ncbi:MAG TPA: SDR family oxidoreductase [Gemmatimonadales bacterium]
MELRGRRALVTGAGVRVGRVIARSLMERGVHTAIHYAHSEQGARELSAAAPKGVNAPTIAADLADAHAARGLGARASQALGGLDILVNSAAIMEQRSVEGATPDDWDRTMNLNLRGAYFVAQGAAAEMPDGGAIVNIADLAALERWTSYAVHCISKAGVVVMTELMAKAYAPKIRVNAIAPGAVLLPDDWDEATRQKFADTTPLKRLGSPADVAAAVIYLLENDYVTGETLVVDGGRRIR